MAIFYDVFIFRAGITKGNQENCTQFPTIIGIILLKYFPKSRDKAEVSVVNMIIFTLCWKSFQECSLEIPQVYVVFQEASRISRGL